MSRHPSTPAAAADAGSPEAHAAVGAAAPGSDAPAAADAAADAPPPDRLRRSWLVGVGALGAAAGVAGWFWRARARQAAAADEIAVAQIWALRFPRPQGGELVMAELRGRPLLINFWATWCPPCVRELPVLDRFAAAQAAQLQVVGLAIDREQAVREFLARTPVSFGVGLASTAQGTALSRALGNDLGGLPFTVLLSAAGEVIQRKIGETQAAELQAWARALS